MGCGSPGIHGTFHSQRGEDLFSHCLLGEEVGEDVAQLAAGWPPTPGRTQGTGVYVWGKEMV